MYRVSSSLTLVLAIFLPVFWLVTIGCFTLFSFLAEDEDLPLRNPDQFRLILSILLVAGTSLIYYFFMRLRRVECTNEHLFVTNYFKTVKIPWTEVRDIQYRKIFLFRMAKIKLSYKSVFGRTIRMITDEDKIHILQACQAGRTDLF